MNSNGHLYSTDSRNRLEEKQGSQDFTTANKYKLYSGVCQDMEGAADYAQGVIQLPAEESYSKSISGMQQFGMVKGQEECLRKMHDDLFNEICSPGFKKNQVFTQKPRILVRNHNELE